MIAFLIRNILQIIIIKNYRSEKGTAEVINDVSRLHRILNNTDVGTIYANTLTYWERCDLRRQTTPQQGVCRALHSADEKKSQQ